MYFESSIINHIVGFLSEQCAALPILRTDLETIIVFSSAFDDMHNSMRNNSHKINLRLEEVRTLLAGVRKESTRLLNMNAKTESERSELKAEKETWEAQKAQLEDMQTFTSTIKLNVGGHQYITSLSTLCQYPDTMLGAMFSGRHSLIPDTDGCYFIDRDGTHFRYILNLLRSPDTYKVVKTLSSTVQEELKCECDYYGLLEPMFPCKKPFICHNKKGKNVEVTHDVEGLFYVDESLLVVCSKCGTADYSDCARPFMDSPYIPYFKRIMEEKGKKILPSQPTQKSLCYTCCRYIM